MKVGDRIRIFEITKSWYSLEEEIIGIQRPEIKEDTYVDYGVDLYLKDKCDIVSLFFNTNNTSNQTQAKHVVTMVIKSLK